MRLKLISLFSALLLVFTFSYEAAATETTTESTVTSATATPKTTDSTSTDIKTRFEYDLEEKRENITQITEAARERFETRKAEFIDQVAEISDQKKQVILTDLVDKFDQLNIKWVGHWQRILDRLSKILDKMDAKSQQLAADGADISDYEELSDDARKKIAEALTLLEEQAGNTYVFDITTESRLGTEVSKVTAQYRADIAATHKAVKAAREAVKAAFTSLKDIRKEAKNEE